MDDAEEVLTEEPRQNSPPDGERPAEHAPGRRWDLPHGCSEPRPRQAEIRTADEVLYDFSGGSAAMDIAQNLKKEENVVVARGGGSKSVQMGLAQTACQGILAGNLKTKVRYLESRLTWNTSFATERATRMTGAWNAWLDAGSVLESEGVTSNSSAMSSRQPYRGALLSGLCDFFGTQWKLHRD